MMYNLSPWRFPNHTHTLFTLYPVVSRVDTWLCTPESLLGGIKPRSATWKASALLLYYFPALYTPSGSSWGPQSMAFVLFPPLVWTQSPYLRGGGSLHPTWAAAPRHVADGSAQGPRQMRSNPSSAHKTRCVRPRSACSPGVGGRGMRECGDGSSVPPFLLNGPPTPLAHTCRRVHCTAGRCPGAAGWLPCWTGCCDP